MQTKFAVLVAVAALVMGGNIRADVVGLQTNTNQISSVPGGFDICGGDTLFLFANPPSQAVGNTFQYRWVGPNGFTSTVQNPKIPFSRGIHSGNYTVEVTGTMGCKSSGTVNVFIADLPSRAIIQGAQVYCTGSVINMRSGANPVGANIKYHWYKGTYPTGNLQAITELPLYNGWNRNHLIYVLRVTQKSKGKI
jgi:hypothetical protein